MKMTGKKRGQVTIFIILGIVILFSTLLILYIRSQVNAPAQSKVQTDQIDSYVTQCLDQVSSDALIRLGQLGGYVSEPAGSNPTVARLDPFNSETLSMQGGKLLLPYWLYQTENGPDRTDMPPLEKEYDGDGSIQSNLEQYIEDNMESCLDKFSVFDAQGIKVAERGILDVSVIFTESDVGVKLDYPINIYYPDGRMETKSDFYTSIPVRLARIYRLAKQIRDYEMKTVFLERDTQNLISIYSRVNSDYLPPMYGGLEFKVCSDEVYWLYNDVFDDMKEVLVANTPYLRIAGTNYEPITIDDPNEDSRQIRQGVYDGMVYNLSSDTYPLIDVSMGYRESFPMQLDFGRNGLLEPKSFSVDMVFSQICMFEYEFYYNLKYPILVTLTDSGSRIDNKDYIFQFPMQVVIKDNFPRVRYSDVFGELKKPDVKSECAPEQRLSGNIKLNIVDRDNNGIDGVNVYFQCGPQLIYDYYDNGTLKNITPFADKCFMGSSSQGIFQSRFPQCQGGGLLMLESDKYLSKTVPIGDTRAGVNRTMTFRMDKIKTLKVDVKKLFVKPPSDTPGPNPGMVMDDSGTVTGCNTDGKPENLQGYEQAIIRLTKTDPQNGEMMVPSLALFSPKNRSDIIIGPGNYTVDIMLIRNERFVGEMTIKKDSESKTITTGPLGGSQTTSYPDKDVLLPTVFSGGAEFNWTVTAGELENSSTITFSVFDEGPPKIIEDVGTPLDHRFRCSELNYARIQPRLSK